MQIRQAVVQFDLPAFFLRIPFEAKETPAICTLNVLNQ